MLRDGVVTSVCFLTPALFATGAVVRSRWPVVARRGKKREEWPDVVVFVVVAAAAAMLVEGNETGIPSLR